MTYSMCILLLFPYDPAPYGIMHTTPLRHCPYAPMQPRDYPAPGTAM